MFYGFPVMSQVLCYFTPLTLFSPNNHIKITQPTHFQMSKLKLGGGVACPIHTVYNWQNLEAGHCYQGRRSACTVGYWSLWCGVQSLHLLGPASCPGGKDSLPAASLRANQLLYLPSLQPLCLSQLFSPISFHQVSFSTSREFSNDSFPWLLPVYWPSLSFTSLFFLLRFCGHFFYVLQVLHISLCLCLFIATIWPKLPSGNNLATCFFCTCGDLTGQIGSTINSQRPSSGRPLAPPNGPTTLFGSLAFPLSVYTASNLYFLKSSHLRVPNSRLFLNLPNRWSGCPLYRKNRSHKLECVSLPQTELTEAVSPPTRG